MLIECKLGSITGHCKCNCCTHLVLSMDVAKHFGPSLDNVANVMLQGAWWLDIVAKYDTARRLVPTSGCCCKCHDARHLGSKFQPVDVFASV